jgi:hypothetical protein
LELAPHSERRLKYLDSIAGYTELDDNERALYTASTIPEAADLSGFARRLIDQRSEKGI